MNSNHDKPTTPSVINQLVAGLLITAATWGMLKFSWLMGISPAMTFAIAGSMYATFLLFSTPRRSGKLLLGLGTIGLPFAVEILGLAWFDGLAAALLWMWIVRCALFHRSPIRMVGDGCVIAAGLLVGAMIGGASFSALAIWTFFLVQPLFVLLTRSSDSAESTDVNDEFTKARTRFESAINRL